MNECIKHSVETNLKLSSFIHSNDNTKDEKNTPGETGYIKLDLCLKCSDKIVSLRMSKSTIQLMNK